MKKDVALGSYYPTGSVVHRLNPCVKIVVYIAFVVAIFVAKNFYGFIASGAFILFCVLLSKVPLRSVLASLKSILFLILFTAFLNLFFSAKTGKILFTIGKFKVTQNAVYFSLFMGLRLITLAVGSALLTLTTTPIELTDGIEALLKPLTYIKFPVHTLALIMSIALRFIPTLTEKTEQIVNAQKARGSDVDSGNFVKKIKALIPILIPLLIASFNIADQLGDAMDARCYNGSNKRTKYKKLKVSLKDFVAILVYAVVLSGIIVCNVFLGRII